MTVRRRRCRALNCPRRVNDRVLFCNVHWYQLPPKYQQPIVTNQEAPAGGTIDDARKVANGIRAAVAYFARSEGKQEELVKAQAAAVSSPATGTTDQVDTSGGSGVASSGASGTTRSGRLSDTFTNL